MSTFNSPTDIVAGSLARSSAVNNLDAAVAEAFALLPTNIAINSGTICYAVDSTGSANAYIVSMPKTATSYVDGMLVVFRSANTNTGASTINVDSLGVKTIKRQNGDDLSAGDIVANVPVSMRYSSATGYFHVNF